MPWDYENKKGLSMVATKVNSRGTVYNPLFAMST